MAVTEAEVRALFPQDDPAIAVSQYLADANVLVTELFATSSLSSDRIDIITKYVAAHLYVLGQQEGGIFQEDIGESSEKRGSTFTLGQGLRLTRWGQMALAFDTSGVLATAEGGTKKTALFRVV